MLLMLEVAFGVFLGVIAAWWIVISPAVKDISRSFDVKEVIREAVTGALQDTHLDSLGEEAREREVDDLLDR